MYNNPSATGAQGAAVPPPIPSASTEAPDLDFVESKNSQKESDERERRVKTGSRNGREFSFEDSLHKHEFYKPEFQACLRMYIVGDDPRVEPNHPRTILIADAAVEKITDRVAMELAARLEVLGRMVDFDRLDRAQFRALGDEARTSNLALLLGDEAVQHDPSIHPSFKREVQHKVRALLWMSTPGSGQRQPDGQWSNN